jgi:hypothetical protein
MAFNKWVVIEGVCIEPEMFNWRCGVVGDEMLMGDGTTLQFALR